MWENLKDSQEVAHTTMRTLIMITELIHKTFDEHKEISDELELILGQLLNGCQTVGHSLDEYTELLAERRSVYGDYGQEKKIKIILVDEDDQNAIDSTEFTRGNGDEYEEEDNIDPDEYMED